MNSQLDQRALHGLVGEIVNRLLPHTESHPAAILFQFFVFFVNIVGRFPHWSVEGKKHYLNLFTLVVGPTSNGRKGSSLGYLKRIFEPIDSIWFTECLKDGLSSGEGLINCVKDGIKEKRVLVIEEEFASVLKMVQRDGNILSQVVRKLWDGESVSVTTRNNPLKATDPHVSLIGHITKSELGRYLNSTEIANGFANRFLPINVFRSKSLPHGGTISEQELSELSDKVKSVVKFSRKVGNMSLDDGAKILWEENYEKLTTRPETPFGEMTARAAPQVRRLACIYALFDKKRDVSREHLQAALYAWQYSEESSLDLFGKETGNPVAKKILNAFSETTELTRNQIMKKVLQNNTSKEDLGEALELLRSKKLIIRHKKRPEAWRLTSSVGHEVRSPTNHPN